MKKIIYRILLISLFIVVVFSIKSYGVSDFSYKLDHENNATITAYHGNASDLTIPNEIDGYNVVTIDEHAFDESRNDQTNGHTIKNLVISEGIKKIGMLAFNGCTSLETVKLPESLTSLGEMSFIGCTKLKSINIPSKIKDISYNTFQETGFTEFNVPENVTALGDGALRLCKNLKKVIIYNDNISFYTIVPEHTQGDGSVEQNYEMDNKPFADCPEDLVLYGNQGSTTQVYAEKNGINFDLISNYEETGSDNENQTPNTNNDTTPSTSNGSSTNLGNGSNSPQRTSNKTNDSTVARTALPQAGTSIAIIGIITIITIGAAFYYLKVKKYKDIK